MIVAGFDGMNFNLQMAPKELKTLFLALSELQQANHKVVADQLILDGFTATTADVFAMLRQFQLTMDVMAPMLKGPNYVAPPEEDVKPEPVVYKN